MSDSPLTRPSLLLRLRDPSDETAWQDFLRAYEPMVLGFCRKRGLQEADARDVAQDVMGSVLRAIQKLEYDRSRGTFRGWLFRVTRSKLANYFGKRGRQVAGSGRTSVQEMLAQQPDPEEESRWDREVEQRLFEWACGEVEPTVEPKTWRAFWLNGVECRPAAEVAEAVGISVGAVYIAKSRTIARIRARVAEVGELPEQGNYLIGFADLPLK